MELGVPVFSHKPPKTRGSNVCTPVKCSMPPTLAALAASLWLLNCHKTHIFWGSSESGWRAKDARPLSYFAHGCSRHWFQRHHGSSAAGEASAITFQVEFDSGPSAQTSMDVYTVQILSYVKKTSEKLEGCDMWNMCGTYICCFWLSWTFPRVVRKPLIFAR